MLVVTGWGNWGGHRVQPGAWEGRGEVGYGIFAFRV